MLLLKCVNRFKDNHDSWKYYQLVDEQGNQETWTDDKLKSMIASNQVRVINLTLTSDGRLVVSKSADEYGPVTNDSRMTDLRKTSNRKYMSTELFQFMLNDSCIRNAVNEGLQSGDVVGNLDGFLTHETDSILNFFETGGQEAIVKNKYMYDLMQRNNNREIAETFYQELSKRFKKMRPYNNESVPSIYVGFNEFEAERLGFDKLASSGGRCVLNSINFASDNEQTLLKVLSSEGWNKIYIMSLALYNGGISYTSAGNTKFSGNGLYFVYRRTPVEFDSIMSERVGNIDVYTMCAW